jgi:hypothetical protein
MSNPDHSWKSFVDYPGVEIKRIARTDDAAFYEINGISDYTPIPMSDNMWKLVKNLMFKYDIMKPKGT